MSPPRVGCLLCLLAIVVGGCRSARAPVPPAPPVADEGWLRATRLGHEAYRQRDLPRAREQYRLALQRGRAAADAPATGLAAYHLAAAEAAAGDADRAAAALREAEYELARAGMDLGETRLLQARLTLAAGDAAAAAAAAAALADEASHPPSVRAAALLLAAECARAQDDPDSALALAARAEASALQIGAAEGAAHAAAIAADVLCKLGRTAEGAERWHTAAAQYRTAGRHLPMAGALAAAARAWHDAGNTERALPAAYQAGRSFAALDAPEPARAILHDGVQWATQAKHTAWAARFADALADATP